MNQYRRRSPGFGILFLLYQVLGVIGIHHIPPVSLALVFLQGAIFLRLVQLPWYKSSGICVSVFHVWYKKEYSRLLFAAFEHLDDWHLYYNMVSFVVKGQSLERRFGSVKFLYITTLFSVATNIVYVGLNMLLSEFDDEYEISCAVGFSGVIFALKVLTTHYNPNYSYQLMGIPVYFPASYVVWLELIIIQLLVPNTSFIGHLAGIVVGLAYVKGPLGFLLDGMYSLMRTILHPRQLISSPNSERLGRMPDQEVSQFVEYSLPGMSEEDQLQRATEESMHDNHLQQEYRTNYRSGLQTARSHENVSTGVTYRNDFQGIYPDLNQIRSKRLAHFRN